jgi:hypothetical protein
LVTETDDKIINDLKAIETNTTSDCLGALKPSIMKDKILSVLPSSDKTEKDKKVISVAFDVLKKIASSIFNKFTRKEDCIDASNRLQNCNACKILSSLLNQYTEAKHKEDLAIILGKFYYKVTIPPEGEPIIKILVNMLKNINPNNDFSAVIIQTLISITLGAENEIKIFNNNAIPILFPFLLKGKKPVDNLAALLLRNVCVSIPLESRNEIVNLGIYDVFFQKLSEILSPEAKNLLSENYVCMEQICACWASLMSGEGITIENFFKSSLNRIMLEGLKIVTEIAMTQDDYSEIGGILKQITRGYMNIASYEFQWKEKLVKAGIIEVFIDYIEKYMKLECTRLYEESVENVIMGLHNLVYFENTEINNGKASPFKTEFNEVDGIPRLFSAFQYFSQVNNKTEAQKKMMDRISMIIGRIYKGMSVNSRYTPVLIHIKNLINDPNNKKISKWANTIWKTLVSPDKTILDYKR